MKCRRDNKPPTFLIITPVFRGCSSPERRAATRFRSPDDTISLSFSLSPQRVSLPPPDTLMSLPPFPPFTLPFRAFLFDLHPIATATQQRRYFFSFFFPLSPSASYFFPSSRLPPPPSAAAFSFFPLFPRTHCLERAEARRWRAQEMPSNVRHDAEPCPFPCSTRGIADVSRACFPSTVVASVFSFDGRMGEFSEGI